MDKISVGSATIAGFRLIRREPIAFLAWWAALVVVGLVSTLLSWPRIIGMYRAVAAGPQAMAAYQAQVGTFQPLGLVVGIVIWTMLPAAAFRAVLYPQDRRFFYLRLGMREVWTLLVGGVVVLVGMAAYLVAAVPIMLVLGVLAAVGRGAGGLGANIAVVVVALIAVPLMLILPIWAMARASLAPVLSFAANGFRLREAWRLSRGHAGRLFLVGLSLFGLMMLMEGLLFGVGLGLLRLGTPNAMQVFLNNPAASLAKVTLPGMLAASLVTNAFVAWVCTAGAAAFADVYRQLRPEIGEIFA